MKKKYLGLSWFNDFNCIGGKCPLTCCNTRWKIALTDEDIDMYQKMDNDFSGEIINGIDINNKQFKGAENYRCSMLTEDGWCKIVSNCGPEYLCATCKIYPRQIFRYGDIYERSVDISCPEVASYLMNCKNIEFDYYDFEDDEAAPLFDYVSYDSLSCVRNFLIELWQAYESRQNIGKYFITLHLYYKLKDKCSQGELSVNEAKNIVATYSDENNIALMFSKAHELAGNLENRMPLLCNFIFSSRNVLITLKDDIPYEIDISLLNDWLQNTDAFYEAISQFNLYFNEKYPLITDNYFVYSLFLNWITNIDDKVYLSEKFYTKCIEYLLIRLIAMMIWKKKGEVNDFNAIIAAIDRLFDHSKLIINEYKKIAKENGLDNEASMLLLTLF